jgi:hypothetical protein
MLCRAAIRNRHFAGRTNALAGVLALALASGGASAGHPQAGPPHSSTGRDPQSGNGTPSTHPAPIVRVPPQSNASESQKVHIAQWMESHRGQSLNEQQRALEAEPGFRQSTPEVQQRMHDRLTQLNSMSPLQRQRAIARTEWMEQLPPERRLQVRAALSNLGALPEERRREVSRLFRSLRDLPDAQRNAYLNTQQVRSQFSDQERGVLNGLFAAQPYLPPAPATPPPGPQAPR